MTIRERMAACQLFTDDDAHYPEEAAELEAARHRGKVLCWEINRLHPDETEKRMELLGQLFGKMGEHVWVEPPIYASYGSNVTLVREFWLNTGGRLSDHHRFRRHVRAECEHCGYQSPAASLVAHAG